MNHNQRERVVNHVIMEFGDFCRYDSVFAQFAFMPRNIALEMRKVVFTIHTRFHVSPFLLLRKVASKADILKYLRLKHLVPYLVTRCTIMGITTVDLMLSLTARAGYWNEASQWLLLRLSPSTDFTPEITYICTWGIMVSVCGWGRFWIHLKFLDFCFDTYGVRISKFLRSVFEQSIICFQLESEKR